MKRNINELINYLKGKTQSGEYSLHCSEEDLTELKTHYPMACNYGQVIIGNCRLNIYVNMGYGHKLFKEK